MPRTSIAVQTMDAFGGNIDDITFTAADAANNMEFTHPGRDCFVIVLNEHSGAQTVDLIGVASSKTFNRATDITLTVPIGSTTPQVGIQAVPPVGFTQSGGTVHLDISDDTSLSLAVVEVAPTSV